MDKMPVRVVLPKLFGGGGDLKNITWDPFREGVDIHRLYGDPTDGASAALLRALGFQSTGIMDSSIF